MGNFTLPISRQVNQVVGIEGVGEMVEKAKRNAEQNQCDNVQFYQANLDQPLCNNIGRANILIKFYWTHHVQARHLPYMPYVNWAQKKSYMFPAILLH